MSQLPLDLPPPRKPARGREDFIISASNQTAAAMIDAWRGWSDGRLALTGSQGAGKTHLGHVWMELTGAEKVAARTLDESDAPALVAVGAVLVEDVDAALDDQGAERALFHLLNLARAEEASLLLTGRAPAGRWTAKTPDLTSRFASISTVRIDPPDDALLEGLIARHFAVRDLTIGRGVAGFLARRIDRSAAAAAEVVARLDRAALATGRKLSLDFVKRTLDL